MRHGCSHFFHKAIHVGIYMGVFIRYTLYVDTCICFIKPFYMYIHVHVAMVDQGLNT